MSEPSLALQDAVVTALIGATAVSALIGERIYDRVPQNPQFPYATIGADQILPDAAECLEGSVEVVATIDVWSRAVGKREAKRVAGAIVTALNDIDLSLDGYRLVLIQHDGTLHLEDPDGLKTHSVLTFKALIDEV